jgi:uncharacterized RDD family membrane protein YckC
LLYLVPILGLIVFSVTGMWALGAAVTATFGGLRRETPKSPAAPVPPAFGGYGYPTTPGATLAAQPLVGGAAQPSTGATAAAPLPPFIAGTTPTAAVPTAQMAMPGAQAAVPEAWQFPRAGFWERVGAGFVDAVLVAVVCGLVRAPFFGSVLVRLLGGPPIGLLVALAYFAGMWAWRGTTVGGIVLNLKVVRLDGKPVTFAVALVRGLAAALSLAMCFLGFIWIAWDKEKQSWHDKIAGTVVVRLPRGVPLVCA